MITANHLGKLVQELQAVTGDLTKWLPEEMFIYASQITLLVNLDCLSRMMLTWQEPGASIVHIPVPTDTYLLDC
jgi:hypothetical protein